MTAPQRYRAYSEAETKNRRAAEPHLIEEVVATGDVPKSGVVKFDSDRIISRVVFFTGPVEEESVCGAIEIGTSGSIKADFADVPVE